MTGVPPSTAAAETVRQAGTEMNALIAERMGWRVFVSWHALESTHGVVAYPYAVRDRQRRGDVADSECHVRLFLGGVGDGGVWSPSSNMTDAMRVLERMALPGCRVNITASGAGYYDVEWSTRGEDGWEVLAEITDCDSLPLAICLAVLESCHD